MTDDALPSLTEFVNTHPTEEDCWQYLREHRWGKDGFTCPDCGEDEPWGLIQTRHVFECYACRKQTSVTAGTILQDTKLDLQTWFLAIYHVIKTKKGITEPELARTLGVHAETAHNIRQKIYRILRRAQQRSLDGVGEADETYVGGKRPDDSSGRGTSKQCVVALVDNKDEEAGNLHLQCVPGAGGENLAPTVRVRVQEGSMLVDGQRGRLQRACGLRARGSPARSRGGRADARCAAVESHGVQQPQTRAV
ncbi:hypothetical protein BRD56_07840 [Thermoplasmatales archaeon SW_10_69_26]|nr:MAG: hypothetical protein BRD56_07840 [Thermoplasmatales archaeon SW_10_69_26]